MEEKDWAHKLYEIWPIFETIVAGTVAIGVWFKRHFNRLRRVENAIPVKALKGEDRLVTETHLDQCQSDQLTVFTAQLKKQEEERKEFREEVRRSFRDMHRRFDEHLEKRSNDHD